MNNNFSYFDINKKHFNHSIKTISIEENKNNEQVFYKKITISIDNFYQFTNNHFYNDPDALNYSFLFKNNQAIEIFINRNKKLDSFTKNLCLLLIRIYKKSYSTKSLINLIRICIENPYIFYTKFVNKLFQIYYIDHIAYSFNKHIKLIDFSNDYQRSNSHFSMHIDNDSKFNNQILNFCLPDQ